MKSFFIKIVIFSFTFSSFAAMAEDGCVGNQVTSPAIPLEKFAQKMAVVSNLASDDVNAKYEAASTYLTSISHTTNFSENDANGFINSLTPICENATLASTFRSKVCTRLSGIHGKLAQKLQMSGISNGKNAYNYLKMAQDLDPNNAEAAIGHALAVVGIYEQGYFIRKLAESKLGISASDEAQKAKADLKRLKLTSNPVYAKLLEHL